MPPKKPLPKPKPPPRPKTPGTPHKGGKKKKKKKPLTDEEKLALWEKSMEKLEIELNEEAKEINEKMPIALQTVHQELDDKTFTRVYKNMKHKWHYFKYCCDLKDMYICKLKDDVCLLDEQKKIMKYLEMEHIDQILWNFFHTIENGIEEYKHRRNKLIKDRYCFISYNLNSAKKDVDYVTAVKHILTDQFQEEMLEIKGEHIFEKDDLERMNIIELENLYEESQEDLEGLWCQLKNMYKTYVSHTDRKRKMYTALQTKDREDDHIIEGLRNKIASLHIQKDEITDQMKRQHEKHSSILDLQSEKSTFLDTLMRMRAALKFEFNEDANRLTFLAKLCNDVIVELKAVEALVAKILKYISLCQKYETLQEKIQPYSIMIESIDVAFNEDFPEYKDLDKFLYRLAQTEIHVDYMESLHRQYQEQEETLQCLVKEVIHTYE